MPCCNRALKEILVSSDHLEDRVALLEHGHLAAIRVARGERSVGSIFKGKVANVLPGMQAAFVDIGLERNAFLGLDDVLPSYLHDELEEDSKRPHPWIKSITQVVKPRQETLVQMVKEPIGTKGGRITTNISLPGRYLVLLPHGNGVGISRRLDNHEERARLRSIGEQIKPESMGVIIRTQAQAKEEAILKRDLEALLQTWRGIQERAEKLRAPSLVYQELGLTDEALRDLFTDDVSKFMVDSRPVYEKVLEFLSQSSPHLVSRVYYYEGSKPLFELYDLESEIEKLLHKKVWLPSGGYIIIEPTEALTVIDVNTGKYVGKHSLEATLLKTNLEAASEIARQIRLRDISGIIVVDFIDMDRKEDRKKLLSAFEQDLKDDRTRPLIFGMTDLGLVEITRKRAAKSLDRLLREECFYCSGHGKILSPESMAIRIERDIRRRAEKEKTNAVLVVTHPEVALYVAGWEGDGLKVLEKAIGKEVFLRADPNIHQERYTIRWESRRELANKLQFVQPNSVMEVHLGQVHPLNMQNGVLFVNGQIVEISNIASRLGEEATVRIQSAGHSYALGEVVS